MRLQQNSRQQYIKAPTRAQYYLFNAQIWTTSEDISKAKAASLSGCKENA
jgi:hypothetical protein